MGDEWTISISGRGPCKENQYKGLYSEGSSDIQQMGAKKGITEGTKRAGKEIFLGGGGGGGREGRGLSHKPTSKGDSGGSGDARHTKQQRG